jgi:NhaP-type Na+/H+ or K+/H+ antiporter
MQGDNVVQEITRVIVGIQCFAVGVELPPHYASRKWFSVGMMLGPIMAFGWVICTVFIWAIFHTSIASASVIAATLTPTDPVLASSILSNSQFSTRIPRRIKHLLSAESGCNDGVSFPFLYIGLYILTKSSAGEVAKNWFLITLLWQCTVGLLIGVVIGWCANRILRFSNDRRYIDPAGLILFWLLMVCHDVPET